MVDFLRSVCTFWAHDHKDNVASAGWMSSEAVAHVLKMAPMTALMAVRHAGLSAVELQMPRLVCHSGWEMEFLTGRFRGRYGAVAVGFRRHLPPPAPPVLSHALGPSAGLTRVSVRDICGGSGVRKRDCRWLHLLYRVLGTPKTKTTLRSKAITSYERMNCLIRFASRIRIRYRYMYCD